MRKVFLGTAGFFLALILALVVYVEVFSTRERRFTAPLDSLVPATLDGWNVVDRPLADTEGMLEHVNKVLRFDDSVQRVYTRGGVQVLVYAAYWKPGKVTTADAGTHNPDSCWVAAGMTRSERLYSQSGDIRGRALIPYEYGVYSNRAGPTPVMFWHLVQGEPQRYEDQKEGWRNGFAGRIERLPLVLADIRRYGLNQKREQLFVRISANRPISELLPDEAFGNLISSIGKLGIFRDTSWADVPAK
jgi:hypothetical protein